MRIQRVGASLVISSILVAACGSSGGTFGSDGGFVAMTGDASRDGTRLTSDASDSGKDALFIINLDAAHTGDGGATDATHTGAEGGSSDASPDHGGPASDAHGSTDAHGTLADGGLGDTSAPLGDASFDAPDTSGLPSFLTHCAGAHTTLTGIVYAPNAIDPIPGVRVYAAEAILPYPTNYCDKCSSPIDPAYAATTSQTDGSFSLDLDAIPFGATIDFAIQIGRFRKHTNLAVTPCQSAVVAPASAEVLPGNSTAGNIPRIAVSSGEADHLDAVLTALGITEYDCYEGRKTPTVPPGTSTCQPIAGVTIADVLTNATEIDGDAADVFHGLDAYNMAFLSCAPGAYANYITTYNQTTMTMNTQNWVNGGGRLFVTDTAYDYIAQAFPAPITWMGQAGTPQPVDKANVGCAPDGPGGSSAHAVEYPVTIDDSALGTWLIARGLATGNPAVAQIQGFYEPWSAISTLNGTTQKIADGFVPIDPTYSTTYCDAPTTTDVPLTAEYDVSTCGRVLFSSFHTYTGTGTSATAANEKIMEYLIFAAAACRG